MSKQKQKKPSQLISGEAMSHVSQVSMICFVAQGKVLEIYMKKYKFSLAL